MRSLRAAGTLAACALGLAFAGCLPSLAPGPRLVQFQVPLGHDFALRKDQTALIAGEALFVTFDEVKDSRCPWDVQCIQAGEGKVEVWLHKTGTRKQEFILSTLEGDARVALYQGYRVELLGLHPIPISGDSLPGYQALFIVQRQ